MATNISIAENLNFNEYVNQLTTFSSLNVIAQAYLQDWQTGQPIDGGVAFEKTLRTAPLDGSLKSLQILDKFLTQLKPQLPNKSLQLEQQLSQRNLLIFIAYYAGVVFGYHAKMPVHWLDFDHLTTAFTPLRKLIRNDFSYSLAVSLHPIQKVEQPFTPALISQTVFFPLVTIMEKLYPQRQSLQTSAPYYGYINDSLSISVKKLLNDWQKNQQPDTQNLTWQIEATASQNQDTQALRDGFLEQNQPLINSPTTQTKSKTVQTKTEKLTKSGNQPSADVLKAMQIMKAKSGINNEPSADVVKAMQAMMPKTHINNQPSADVEKAMKAILAKQNKKANKNNDQTTTETILSIEQQKIVPTITAVAKTTKKPTQPTALKSTRQVIKEAKQQAKEIERQKAEEKIRKQAEAKAKRQAQVAEALANPKIHENLLNQKKSMVDKHQKIHDIYSELENDLQHIQVTQKIVPDIQQTYVNCQKFLTHGLDDLNVDEAKSVLMNLQQVAKLGQTDAILQLALYYFRGTKYIKQNREIGLNLLQKAGNLGDCRAEKFLSKLYFSGVGVVANNDIGSYWLNQAAKHGHPEAKKLLINIDIGQQLQEYREDEDFYLKWFKIGGIALLIILLFALFGIKV